MRNIPYHDTVQVNDRVRVYRNLNKKGVVWSIQSAKTKLVLEHAGTVWLSDVEFKVSEAGRRRVLDQKRKNVHAFVIGDTLDQEPEGCLDWRKAHYNPYTCESFLVGGQPIYGCRYARLDVNGLYIII